MSDQQQKAEHQRHKEGHNFVDPWAKNQEGEGPMTVAEARAERTEHQTTQNTTKTAEDEQQAAPRRVVILLALVLCQLR